MSNIVYPTHFTYSEGGYWISCPLGYHIPISSLESAGMEFFVKVSDPEKVRTSNTYRVHSFQFGGYANEQGTSNPAPRWDVINGWTVKMKGANTMRDLTKPDPNLGAMLATNEVITKQAAEIVELNKHIEALKETKEYLLEENKQQKIASDVIIAASEAKANKLIEYILGKVPWNDREAALARLNKWLEE
jgi:hypothetical protein